VRVSLLAELHGRVVAAAGYERLREEGAAEVAFAVSDELQGQGLGTRLLEQLAELAEQQGIHRFDAEVLTRNRAMIGVFEAAGFRVHRHTLGAEMMLVLDLAPTQTFAERRAARDHRATVASLRPLLRPEVVAVVGASADGTGPGARIVSGLRVAGFAGIVHAVNRPGRLAELDPPPELVVVAVRADAVEAAAAEAADAGARALVVLSTGFAELGTEEGRAREARLLSVARARGVRLLGPNSLGVLSLTGGRPVAAALGAPPLRRGSVAISSSSGGLGLALLGQAAGRGIGVAAFAALGNRADVSTNDLLEWWEDDDEVETVLLYVGSFGNPRRFAEIARRVARVKPLVAVHGHHPGPAVEDPGSHVAQALSRDAQTGALMREAGVLRVTQTSELFDAAALLAGQPLPRGRSVAVVANAAGLGRLAADALEDRGLALARVGDETLAALAPVAETGRPGNPLDLAIHAGPDRYATAVRVLGADPGVDAVVALHAPLGQGDPAAVLRAVDEAAAGGLRVPVAACVLDATARPVAADGIRVPNHRFPERAAGALALAAERAEWLARPLGRRPEPAGDIDAARDLAQSRLAREGPGWLPDAEAAGLLMLAGIHVLAAVPCATVDAALAAAVHAGAPVAVKALLPPPAHSGDLDAALIGLEGEAAVRAGWVALRERVEAAGREFAGVAIQPLAGAGPDVLVGAVADAALGAVVGLGLGGRLAGLAGDIAFRLPPHTDADADELLAAAPAVGALLAGHRGAPPRESGPLCDLALRLGALVEAVPEIVEADLNPVRLEAVAAVPLDARVRIGPLPRAARLKTW
jgi:acyl-CoA synthetase (NDP forming)/GNAT superfamily N-acetyltransferase